MDLWGALENPYDEGGVLMLIGYTYVVGDVIHLGHIYYLRNAKALCNKLIVGVLTDEAVMERKPRPAISFIERVRLISEIRNVDVIVAQETYSPMGNVHIIKPDILIESSSHDQLGHNPHGRTIVLPYFPAQSSSQIKRIIRSIE